MDFDLTGAQFAPENFENNGQALSMSEYFDAKDKWFHDIDGRNLPGHLIRPDYSLSGRIGSFFTGQNQYLEDEYNNYLVENQRRLEASRIASARAWEEKIDSEKYQRAVKDLKAAGLNPALAVQNGLSGSTISPGSTSYSTSARKFESHKNDGKDANVVSGIVNTALRLAMLAIAVGA